MIRLLLSYYYEWRARRAYDRYLLYREYGFTPADLERADKALEEYCKWQQRMYDLI